uniref:SCP domain-containing protein n=1 Tax=Globodera pallida TaxID=36090 RepID=A0A183BKT5_GLOPA
MSSAQVQKCFYMLMVVVASVIITTNGLPNPLGTNDGVWVSHSGPTNALWGHEKLVPEQELFARQKRRSYYPSSYGYSYSSSYGAGNPPDTYQQNWITSEHNRYRRMVPATDMRMVYWNQQLAASAQAHANTCDFRHSQNRMNIGENIWAAPYYNYTDAVGRWVRFQVLYLASKYESHPCIKKKRTSRW